jgi:agmatine deiminase
MMKPDLTPRSLGFHFPAEFEKQSAMWLSWPHKEASWPGKLDAIYDPYCEFILQVADHQRVNINVADATMERFALEKIMHSKYATKLPTISDVLE